MKNKILIYFTILMCMASILKANDAQDTEHIHNKVFTVTSIVLDVQEERVQAEEDRNETTVKGVISR